MWLPGGLICGGAGDAVLHGRNLSLVGEPHFACRVALALVMIDQRSEPKKPLPGEFLHEKIKFPRSGENR